MEFATMVPVSVHRVGVAVLATKSFLAPTIAPSVVSAKKEPALAWRDTMARIVPRE